jgi:hypothetical protein
MSYKDLEDARAKRVVKDTIKETKGKDKRDRKYQKATLEVEETTAGIRKRGRKRKNIMLGAELEIELEELELEPNTKITRTSKTLAPSRALVIQILIADNKIMPKTQKALVTRI